MKSTIKVLTLVGWIFVVACSTSQIAKKEFSASERARIYLGIANGALEQNDPTGALQAIVKAEELDDSIPEIYHTKALAFFRKHDLSTALESVRRAVVLNPSYSEANNTLGSFLIHQGQFDQAYEPLLKAAKDPLYRDSYMAWTNLGILKYRQGVYSEAKIYFDHAILDAPGKACSAYYYRGQIRQTEHKLNEAIEDFRSATRRFCVNFGEAELALGLAYQKKRDYTLARKTFLGIHERHPNTPLAERAMEQLRYLP